MKRKPETSFFRGIANVDDLKALYRKLAIEHHPDKGGDTATMQAINAEYAYVLEEMLRSGGNRTEQEIHNQMDIEAELMAQIQKIAGIAGIIIEIAGKWIWVTGNTYPVRSDLKTAGFMFASKKKAWFFRREEDQCCGNRSELSLDQIREKHGSKTVIVNGSFLS